MYTVNLILNQFKYFLTYNQALSTNTCKSYLYDLKAALTATGATEFDDSIVSKLIDYILSNNKSHATQARHLSAIKLFIQFLSFKGLIIHQSPKLNKILVKVHNLPKFIDIEKIINRIDQCNSYYMKIRDIAILGFMCGTGIRVSELINISLDQVRTDHVIVTGKGNKQRKVPLTAVATKHLASYMKVRDKFKPKCNILFLSNRGISLSRQRIFQITKSILDYISPHDLRHAFATFLVNEGVDLRIIQIILGHSSISSTQIYTYVGSKALKCAVEQFHPMAKNENGFYE